MAPSDKRNTKDIKGQACITVKEEIEPTKKLANLHYKSAKLQTKTNSKTASKNHQQTYGLPYKHNSPQALLKHKTCLPKTHKLVSKTNCKPALQAQKPACHTTFKPACKHRQACITATSQNCFQKHKTQQACFQNQDPNKFKPALQT